MVSFPRREYKEFDVPKNAFSGARYEKEKFQSLKCVRAGYLRTFAVNPKRGTRGLGRFPFRERVPLNKPRCRAWMA